MEKKNKKQNINKESKNERTKSRESMPFSGCCK